MEKEEFIQSQDVDDELATRAWEKADGDESEAKRLLTPSHLTIKGRMTNREVNIDGLFFLIWNFQDDKLDKLNGVILNDYLDDFSLADSHEAFAQQFQRIKESPQVMSGYTEELNHALEILWEDSYEELLELIEDSNVEELETRHREVLTDVLELDDFNLKFELEIDRSIEEDDGTEEPAPEDQDEPVVVPSCDVHVTPVKGVSVTALQPGDSIYVELGDIPGEWSKLRPILEDLRDETGLIPARLQEKARTDDGRFELEVQFGQNVFGSMTCGRDVSLMVPDHTLEKYRDLGDSGIEDFLDARYVFPAIVVLILLIVLTLLIT